MNDDLVTVCIKYRRPKSKILPKHQRNFPDAFVSLKPQKFERRLYDDWAAGDREARERAYEKLREMGYPVGVELYFQKNNGGSGRPPKFRRRVARPNEGFITFDKGSL